MNFIFKNALALAVIGTVAAVLPACKKKEG